MRYSIAEGSFETAAPIVDDQSITILVFQEPESKSNYTLVINRDRMEAGETPHTCCERQIKILERQFKDFKQTRSVSSGVISPNMPAAQFESELPQNGTKIYQIQTMVQIGQGNKTLVFTLSGSAPFNAAQRKHFQSVLTSLNVTLLEQMSAS